MSADDRFAARQEKLKALLEKRAPAAHASEPKPKPKPEPIALPDGLPLSMSITDARRTGHGSAADFIDELVAAVNAWWQARGAGGCAVSFAAYADDIATIETQPGTRAITIADVRAAFVRKEAA